MSENDHPCDVSVTDTEEYDVEMETASSDADTESKPTVSMDAKPTKRRRKSTAATKAGIQKVRRSRRDRRTTNRQTYMPARDIYRHQNRHYHSCEECPGAEEFGWECTMCRTYYPPDTQLECIQCPGTILDWICGCISTRQPIDKDPLLHKRVAVLWGSVWYAGTIQDISLPNDEGTHNVLYDGDMEAISEKLTGVGRERWKIVKA